MDRERLNSISRYYTGRELQKILHPHTLAPHSSQLYTSMPGTIVVTGDACRLDAFVAGFLKVIHRSRQWLTTRSGL